MSELESKLSVEAVGVKIENLSKSFGDQAVLKNISLEVNPGEIFVIMGPSGSGKSVLLKHIIGLEKANSGVALIEGKDASLQETHEKFHTAIVFQAGALFQSMSVFDNLALYLRENGIKDKEQIKSRVGEALRALSLEHAADKFPSELSGGMKKRVAIARALVMEPQLLLYDEPTSELDPTMAATISEIIASVRNKIKITSIVVSHDRDLSLTIADRVAILMDGELLIVDTPDKVKSTSDSRVQEFLNPQINLDQPRYEKSTHQ